MAGTAEGGSRDNDWSITGTSQQLAAHWADLEGGREYVQTKASFDPSIAIDAIKSAAQVAADEVVNNAQLATVLLYGFCSPVLGLALLGYYEVTGQGSYLLPR
jgi:hypothetical protein